MYFKRETNKLLAEKDIEDILEGKLVASIEKYLEKEPVLRGYVFEEMEKVAVQNNRLFARGVSLGGRMRAYAQEGDATRVDSCLDEYLDWELNARTRAEDGGLPPKSYSESVQPVLHETSDDHMRRYNERAWGNFREANLPDMAKTLLKEKK